MGACVSAGRGAAAAFAAARPAMRAAVAAAVFFGLSVAAFAAR